MINGRPPPVLKFPVDRKLSPAQKQTSLPVGQKGEKNLIDVGIYTTGLIYPPTTPAPGQQAPLIDPATNTLAGFNGDGKLVDESSLQIGDGEDNRVPAIGQKKNKKKARRRRKRFSQSDGLLADNKINQNEPKQMSERIAITTGSSSSGNGHDSNSSSTSSNNAHTAISTIDTRKLKCRVERNLFLDFEEYQHYSCAVCYK